MSLPDADRESLLALAESGALSRAQLDAAARLLPLAPSGESWLRAADRTLAVAGALLLAAGLIFFFAYNWDTLHRFAKLGLAGTALFACVAVAFVTAPFGTAWRAALLAASIATGALLALIGQIYQTGADVWELFAAWAALMMPFALLARSSACWVLWLTIANAALLRGLSQSAWLHFFGALDRPGALFAIAALNALVLIAFEVAGAALLAHPHRHVMRLAGVGVLAPLAIGACLGWWERDFVPLILAFLATAALSLRCYLGVRRDVPLLAATAFSGIAVASAALTRLLEHGSDFLSINLIAGFVIASTAFAGVWLKRLYQEGKAA
ncbi:MAG TPA: DUF2157 domain-containing protein [Aromatoleum sp.]|uniref:DUF2157 domain-containing protein n=1 Tax=Aromatoleum sp. TaxID=2307007 RepID=UPI002B479035|nr:DUF2157 domain-containing protein [Aromatoleum sp.]HJV25508.1 DUF2157 domain-containing protein [Aromatoleum sp.]